MKHMYACMLLLCTAVVFTSCKKENADEKKVKEFVGKWNTLQIVTSERVGAVVFGKNTEIVKPPDSIVVEFKSNGEVETISKEGGFTDKMVRYYKIEGKFLYFDDSPSMNNKETFTYVQNGVNLILKKEEIFYADTGNLITTVEIHLRRQ